jgi:hypothetical protein
MNPLIRGTITHVTRRLLCVVLSFAAIGVK